MQQLVKEKIGSKLYYPYKLCDYKPCYGYLFEEHTRGYDYWGYCDIDTLWGDMDAWLGIVMQEGYDRIGRYGHFTLYRNTEKMRMLYLHGDNKRLPVIARLPYIKQTAFPCNFDELGMNLICEQAGLRFLKEVPLLNTSLGYKHLHSWDKREEEQVWLWEDGKVYSLTRDADGKVKREERAYLHFMTFNLPLLTSWTNKMCVTHDGILSCMDMSDEEVLDKWGTPDTSEEHIYAQTKMKKRLKAKSRSRVKAEFKYCSLRAITNIMQRYLYMMSPQRL